MIDTSLIPKDPKALRALAKMHVELVKNKEAARRCETDLREFVKQAWHVVEPATEFSPGWHIDAITDHLSAVTNGQIKNLLINVPPRHMKPVWEEEPVLERDRGRIKLADVVVGDYVLTHAGRFRRVSAVHEQGDLPLLQVSTFGGRKVKTAYDHPYLTPRGWIEAQHLTDRDRVAAVTPQEPCGTRTITPEEARLMGYLIGDGCCKYAQITLTNEDEDVLLDAEHCAETLGFHTRRKVKIHCKATSLVFKSNAGRWNHNKDGPSPLRRWLDLHELSGVTSYTKRVPAAIMAASSELIAEFLGAYWSCDGHISCKHAATETREANWTIGCDTVSEGLARDVQHLLLRLGMVSRLRRKEAKLKSKRQGDTYVSWTVIVCTTDDCSKFAEIIPIAHAKRSRLDGFVRSGFDRVLREDLVMSVLDAGAGKCRCLSVEEDSSFTAGDIAVHNSLAVSVFWPAWEWITNPAQRWLFMSYSSALSIRDSVKCRRLIQSKWYQRNFGDRYQLTSDQNAKEKYETDKTGHRIASSVGGIGTGEGADRICCDDPISASDAESETILQGVLDWWSGTMSSRSNDPRVGSRVIVMQRLNELDLSGYVLEHGGFEHLVLPMRYESDRKCFTSINFVDPRVKDGELLWPNRFGEAEAQALEKALGTARAAGQLQQRPSPVGGGIIKKHWWKYWQPRGAKLKPVTVRLPDGTFEQREAVDVPESFGSICQSWDLPFKDKKDSDFVAGIVVGALGADRFILDSEHDRMDLPETLNAFRRMSMRWPNAHLKLVEGKANGPAVIQSLRHEIGGLVEVEPNGTKAARLAAAAPSIESGNWYLPHPALATWVQPFIDELSAFPVGAHDDWCDCVSQACARMLYTTPRSKLAKKPYQPYVPTAERSWMS